MKEGGKVRYTMKLTNGAQTIQGADQLSLTVRNATASNTTCWREPSKVLVPLSTESISVALGSNIPGGNVIMCTFDVVVLDVHENNGAIPELAVQAAYLPPRDVLFIPTSGLIAPWPVFTNTTVSTIEYVVDIASPSPMFGKWVQASNYCRLLHDGAVD